MLFIYCIQPGVRQCIMLKMSDYVELHYKWRNASENSLDDLPDYTETTKSN